MPEDEMIDRFLFAIQANNHFEENGIKKPFGAREAESIFQTLLDEGLIHESTRGLTAKARAIMRSGGYAEYKKRLEEKERLDKERDDLETILAKSNIEANIFQMKMAKKTLEESIRNRRYSVFFGAIGIINVLVFIWQVFGESIKSLFK